MREKQSSYQVTSAHGSGEHPPAGKQADRSGSRQKARCDMGQTRPGQGTPISMSDVIRIWRQAWEEFTPFLKVPARASQNRIHHQRRRKCPLSTTKSHQNQGAFPHRPISSQAAAPRRPKHNQQTRRKPRHRHPRLENSPKPTRNPLPQPTKPNPLKTHEPMRVICGGCGSAGGDGSMNPCAPLNRLAVGVSASPPVARSVLSLDRSVT